MTITLTDRQKKFLKSALGAHPHVPKKDWGYRNHFCAGVGSQDQADLDIMVSMGLFKTGTTINNNQSVFYHATVAGMDAIGLTPEQKANALEDLPEES